MNYRINKIRNITFILLLVVALSNMTVCFVNRKCNKMTRKMQHPTKPTLLNYGLYNYVLPFRQRSA
ncbi:MAG: hypothetical protein JG777_1959 [Clostridia bacterium]|nr:hypothetical protein [Clostridia bacterium]